MGVVGEWAEYFGGESLVLTCGDSLYTTLTDAEVADLTKAVVKHTAGRALVIASDNMWWTGKVIEFAKYVKEIGGNLLMVCPPDWAASCTPETLARHYKEISGHIQIVAVSGPWVNRSVEFALKVLEMLLEADNGVVCLKDDSYDSWRCVGSDFGRKAGTMAHDKWPIFAVWKGNFLDAMKYGCDGYLSNFFMFKPEVSKKFYNAVQLNELEKAKEIVDKYEKNLKNIMLSFPGGMDAIIRGVFELAGVIYRWRRKPYYNLDDGEMEKLKDMLDRYGLL